MSIEGFNQESEEKSENPADKIDEARRNFLKRMGGLTAGAALGGISPFVSSAENRAERGPESIYEQGIRDLRKMAIENPSEVARFFVEDKNGEGKWTEVFFPEALHANVANAAVMISVTEAEENLKNPDNKVTSFHTHPLGTIKGNPSSSKKEEGAGARLPSQSPSITDVVLAIGMSIEIGENSRRLGYGVVDPGGVWKYEIDYGNPTAKKMVEFVRKGKELLRVIEREPEKYADLKRIYKDEMKDVPMQGRFARLQGMKDSLSPDSRRIVEEVGLATELLSQDEHFLNASASSMERLENDERIKKTIENYLRMGVRMTFTPHKEK